MTIGIEEIKNSMLRSKDLFNNGVSITLDVISEELVNCYAYALGNKWKKQQPKVIQPNLVPELGPTVINSIWDGGFILQYEATGYFAIKES